jgi:hypothetical protein
MDRDEAERIAAAPMTVSDKIRALDAAGYPRAEIARVLGKRYQHVRNVLEGDKLQRPQHASPAPVGVAEPSSVFGGVYRLEIGPDGTVRLPPEVMAALELRPGGVLISHLEPNRLVILSTKAAWRRVQELAAPYARPGDRLASEELIEDRRSGELWGD